MKKYILAFFFISFLSTSFAQDKVFKMTPQDTIVPKVKEEKLPKTTSDIEFRKIIGGSAWFNAWGAYSYFEASPVGAYKLNEKTHVGLGATYRYVSGYSYASGAAASYSVYGGRTFIRYMLFQDLYAHAEYELMYGLPNLVQLGSAIYEERNWVGGALLGASYRSMMGQRTASVLTVLYNATYVQNSTPSPNPLVIRVSLEYEF